MSFTDANTPKGKPLSYLLWIKCERALPKTPRSADAKDVLATLIETEEAAKRLARVILSDVQLYNKDLIATGGDLTAALHEGRHHFKSRVAAAMHEVFDKVAVERKLLAPPPGYEPGPPAEKTPVVVSTDDRATPVAMDALMDAAPTVVQGTMALPPAPEDDIPQPTPAPAPVATIPKPIAAPAPRKPAPAPEPPVERTPPPIPQRARVAPVQITITATPPPPAPYETPWSPPAVQAPVFAAPPPPVAFSEAPTQHHVEEAPSPIVDIAVPNLKPPFPWIRIILLVAVAVGIVAGVVHLTR